MRGRLLSIIRKEFIHIVRDPRTLAITFVMPLVMLLLLGFAATTDVRNVPLAVWDQDRSPESRALVDAYRAADYFRVAFDVGSDEEIEQLITSGAAPGRHDDPARLRRGDRLGRCGGGRLRHRRLRPDGRPDGAGGGDPAGPGGVGRADDRAPGRPGPGRRC